jgi:hypothetical protein
MSENPAPLQEDFPALYQVLGHLKMPDIHFEKLEHLLTMVMLVHKNIDALKEYGRAERDDKKLQKITRELLDVRARVRVVMAPFQKAISKIPLRAGPKFPGVDLHAHELLMKAARADSRKAQEALAHAAQIIDAGEPLPLPISNWVSDAFVEASKSDNGPAAARALAKMLNLVGKKNQTHRANPVMVAGAIMELHKDGNGLKLEDAYAQVSETFSISRNLAEDYNTKKNRDLYLEALEASRET